MTTIELLATIKAEVLRLKERAEAERVLHPQTILAAKNYLLIKDYDNLLSFLDTIEAEAYDPYKTTVESILRMFYSYSITTDKADFIANIRVKCKDAVEYATGKRPVESEEKDAFCKENCKGYQDTGKCFCDGGCEAKKKSKEKEVDLEKEISNYYTLKKPEIWFHQFHELARYFYKLGLNSKK